jgi:hypothetical protein
VSHLLPDKADPTALQMYLARGNMSFFEMSNVQKKMSKDFVKELDKIDFTSVL